MEKNKPERKSAGERKPAPAECEPRAVFADVAVIGAGASGLAAAVLAAGRGRSVVIAEGNEKAGKKLYATGNGRCNFTNRDCTPESFNRPDDRFVESVLSRFGTEETLRFFQSQGMMARLEEGGRYYPYSGQASAVVKALERAAKKAGCRFLFSERAVKTEFSEDMMPGSGRSEAGFRILTESGRKLYCRRLILACGGRAGLKTGSTGDGYGFAKSFGHTLEPPRPALTAAESEAEFLRELKGVRARGNVTLYERAELPEVSRKRRYDEEALKSENRGLRKVAAEMGEIQFTATGISGICVFDLTRRMDGIRPPATKKKREKSGNRQEKAAAGKEYVIACDFVPEKSEEELYRMISGFSRHADGEASGGERYAADGLADILSGIVNERLAEVIAKLSEGDARRAAGMLRCFEVPISHTRGWEDAQVTCGGVRREEICPGTLESRLQPGLFFCGEVIDVDGRCGGFNLQWAWSSGAAAGCAAGGETDVKLNEEER